MSRYWVADWLEFPNWSVTLNCSAVYGSLPTCRKVSVNSVCVTGIEPAGTSNETFTSPSKKLMRS